MKKQQLYLIAPEREGLLQGNPYSLLYLAEWARRFTNCDVQIVNNISAIPSEGLIYVGITVTTPTYRKGLELATEVKEINPGSKIILGGPHTRSQGDIIYHYHPNIDYVVEGSGEKALVEILQGIPSGVIKGEPLTSGEMDSLSISDLINLDGPYFGTLRQFGRINYISSIGCSYKCSFCASSGKLTAKSVTAILDDLETLSTEGFSEVSIQDNYFGYRTERIKEICKGILQRGLHLNFDCQTRVESMQDPGLIELMKRAGCGAAYIGVENFHPKALRMLGKTRNSECYPNMIEKAVHNLLRAYIIPLPNLQVGLPAEDSNIRAINIRSLKQLGRLAAHYNTAIPLYTHLNVVYPGTPDYYTMIAKGVSEDVYERFTFWSEIIDKEIDLLIRRNHFIHGAGGIPLGVMDFDSVKNQEFRIDHHKICQIDEYLEEIGNIENIRMHVHSS